MDNALIPASRPGNLALSVFALSGLTLLAAQLWTVASGYVILLFIPALLACLYQMVLTREEGLRLDARQWRVTTGDGHYVFASDDIAHLRIIEHGQLSRAVIVMTDGAEFTIPFDLAPDADDLTRAAGAVGVPVQRG
jgi:hypothetical protein